MRTACRSPRTFRRSSLWPAASPPGTRRSRSCCATARAWPWSCLPRSACAWASACTGIAGPPARCARSAGSSSLSSPSHAPSDPLDVAPRLLPRALGDEYASRTRPGVALPAVALRHPPVSAQAPAPPGWPLLLVRCHAWQ